MSSSDPTLHTCLLLPSNWKTITGGLQMVCRHVGKDGVMDLPVTFAAHQMRWARGWQTGLFQTIYCIANKDPVAKAVNKPMPPWLPIPNVAILRADAPRPSLQMLALSQPHNDVSKCQHAKFLQASTKILIHKWKIIPHTNMRCLPTIGPFRRALSTQEKLRVSHHCLPHQFL